MTNNKKKIRNKTLIKAKNKPRERASISSRKNSSLLELSARMQALAGGYRLRVIEQKELFEDISFLEKGG